MVDMAIRKSTLRNLTKRAMDDDEDDDDLLDEDDAPIIKAKRHNVFDEDDEDLEDDDDDMPAGKKIKKLLIEEDEEDDLEEDEEEQIIPRKAPKKKVIKEETDDEDDEDDEEPKVAPKKKASSSKAASKKSLKVEEPEDDEEDEDEAPAPKKASTKKASNKKAKPVEDDEDDDEEPVEEKKTSSRVKKSDVILSEDEVLELIMEKVNAHREQLDKFREDKGNGIPRGVKITQENFDKILASKLTENIHIFKGLLTRLGLKKDDIDDDQLMITPNEAGKILEIIRDVEFTILSKEAGYQLFSNDNCVCSLEGSKQKERVVDKQTLLKTLGIKPKDDSTTHTLIKPWIKVGIKCAVSAKKKIAGNLDKKGKFVPAKN